MQLGQAQIVRSEWYDRSPLTKCLYYSSNHSPLADTLRISYEVPANRVLRVGGMGCNLRRTLVAGVVGYATMWVAIDEGIAFPIAAHRVSLGTNILEDSAYGSINGDLLVTAGNRIAIWTGDSSTGGTIHFFGGIFATEYDA